MQVRSNLLGGMHEIASPSARNDSFLGEQERWRCGDNRNDKITRISELVDCKKYNQRVVLRSSDLKIALRRFPLKAKALEINLRKAFHRFYGGTMRLTTI